MNQFTIHKDNYICLKCDTRMEIIKLQNVSGTGEKLTVLRCLSCDNSAVLNSDGIAISTFLTFGQIKVVMEITEDIKKKLNE